MSDSSPSYTNTAHRFMQVAAAVVFLAFLIGTFITRGHAAVAVASAVALWIFAPQAFAWPKLSAPVWGGVVAFIALAVTISALYSPQPTYALGATAGAAGFVLAGLMLWAAAMQLTLTQANKLYDYSRIAVRISTICLTILLASPKLISLLHPSQVGESVVNRSVVALVLLAGVYIAASIRRRQLGDAWLIYLWISVLAFISDSETAKLVVVLAPFSYVFMGLTGWFGRSIIAAIVLGYSFAAPWIAGPFFTWVQNLPLSSATFRGAFGARAEIWDAVAQVVQRQPLTGYGLESTRLMKDLPIKGIFWPEKLIAHPHNAALQIWADLGLGGAALLAIAFIAAIWACRHLKRHEAAATQTLIMMVFCVFQVSHGVWQSWWLGLLGLVGFLTHALIVKGGETHAVAQPSWKHQGMQSATHTPKPIQQVQAAQPHVLQVTAHAEQPTRLTGVAKDTQTPTSVEGGEQLSLLDVTAVLDNSTIDVNAKQPSNPIVTAQEEIIVAKPKRARKAKLAQANEKSGIMTTAQKTIATKKPKAVKKLPPKIAAE